MVQNDGAIDVSRLLAARPNPWSTQKRHFVFKGAQVRGL